MSSSGSGPAQDREWIDTSVAALSVAALVLVAWLLLTRSTLPLFGDYAEWTYHGVLLRDVLERHADAGYWLKNYPVPNSLTTVGLAALMLVLPWQVAAKVWLVLGCALGWWCGFSLQRAAGAKQRWQLLVFTGGAILGTAFWFGFENFLLGTFLTILFAATLLREAKPTWVYGALLVLIFFSHMVAFGFALMLLLLFAAQHRRWRLLWQAVPSLLLTMGYFVGRAIHGNADAKAGMVNSVPWGTSLFAAFKVNTLLKNWGFVNPAAGQTDSVLLKIAGVDWFVLLFVLNLLVAVVALVLVGRTAWASWKERRSDRFVWATVALFVAAGLILPGALAGISDPGGRMLQMALWSGVLLVKTRRRWVGIAVALCALIMVGTNCVLVSEVALRPAAAEGSVSEQLPAHLREFAHVYYAHAAEDYGKLAARQMDVVIYPTAMFLGSGARR